MLTLSTRRRLTLVLIVVVMLLAVGVAASILMHLSLELEPVAPDGDGEEANHLIAWATFVALLAMDLGLILRYRKAFARRSQR